MNTSKILSKTRHRLEAAPYPTEKYEWYTYNAGTSKVLKSKKGRKLTLRKGSKFGVRPASSKKGVYRLIVEEFGPGIVFTITAAIYDSIVKVSKSSKKPNDEHDEVVDDDKFEKLYDNELPKLFSKRVAEIKKNGINLGTSIWLRLLAKDLNKLDTDRKHDKHYSTLKKILESKIPVTKPKRTKDATFLKLADIQIKSALSTSGKFISAIIGGWSWYEDPDMVAMTLNDMASHIELAVAFCEKNEKRIDKLSNMDTSSREEIPMKVWDFIVKHY